MGDTIESELAAMTETNLGHLIPSHLFSNFKIELNDRILTNLIGELDHLLQTSDANSSFKILTLNDKSEQSGKRSYNEGPNDNDAQNDTTISSLSSSCFINKNSKSFLVEMASRLLEIFTSYHNSLVSVFELFEAERQKSASLFDRNNNKAERLASKEELILYQRAILVQKLSRRHYSLLNLLFRHAFDFYNKENNIQEGDEENESDEDETDGPNPNESSVNMMDMSDDQSKSLSKKPNLIQKFHDINRIL